MLGIVMGEVMMKSIPYPNHSVVQVASLVCTQKLRWTLEQQIPGSLFYNRIYFFLLLFWIDACPICILIS